MHIIIVKLLIFIGIEIRSIDRYIFHTVSKSVYWISHSFLLPGAGGPRIVTIEKLKERTKATDSQLDTEIKDTVLASHFDNVETYPVQLGLDPSERRDVTITASNYNTKTGMDKALRLWRQHNPGAATHRGGADSRPTLGGGQLDEGKSGPPKKKIRVTN